MYSKFSDLLLIDVSSTQALVQRVSNGISIGLSLAYAKRFILIQITRTVSKTGRGESVI